MRQLSVKWEWDPHYSEESLIATYKKHKLRMTFDNKAGLYIGWVDGIKKISAESKGELYRKYADEF